MGRSLLVALALAASGCAPPKVIAVAPAPECPEARPVEPREPASPPSIEAPPQPADEPETTPEPVPTADLEWGFIEPEDVAPRAFDDLTITISPFETDAADGSLALIARVTVADPQGPLATFEHPVDTGFCGSEVSTAVETVGHRSLSETIFDAQVTCSVGESHPRWNTSHTVFLVDEDARTATLLVFVEAGSWVVVEESQDVRDHRFFLEADTLAVYQERSAWCDAEAVFAAQGVRERGCKVSARTLGLKQRIALD